MKTLNVTNPDVARFSSLLEEATLLARKFGVDNITQPGLIKEIIMAQKLEHSVIFDKHLPDAIDADGNYYEYLSCQNPDDKSDSAKNFAIDCMFSRPENDFQGSLNRIRRNKTIYCGVFKGVFLEEIWEVGVEVFLNKTVNNLVRRDKDGTSKNREHTVNYSLKWVKSVGTKVYCNDSN